MKDNFSDTIAAISTPLGEGGIGVIRISGIQALPVLNAVFLASKQQKTLDSHRLYHGHILDLKSKKKIDEVMSVYMQAPDTYTGEDTVEISGHGGVVILNQILEQILGQGARLAQRGEFTKRAFLNGRIDLSQAEAVIDLIKAKTPEGASAAMQQLEGRLTQKVRDIRTKPIEILMSIEANLDLESEVGEISLDQITAELNTIHEEINQIIIAADAGIILRNGVLAVIIGRPNVGKSSLLNALLRHERAIVTEIPGTTRDSIEEAVNIRGIPFCLVDTAGLREAENKIEELGIRRTQAHLTSAEIILLVLDLSQPLTEEDAAILMQYKNRRLVIVLNKNDLGSRVQEGEIANIAGNVPQVRISALTGEGIPRLEDEIMNMVVNRRVIGENAALVTNVRHKESLEKALGAINSAMSSLSGAQPLDIISIDIKEAIVYLGEVSGETVSEEVIHRIFEEFCVGK